MTMRHLRKCLIPGVVTTFVCWICYAMLSSDDASKDTVPLKDEAMLVLQRQMGENNSGVMGSPLADSLADLRKQRLLRKVAANRNGRAVERLKTLAKDKKFRYVIVVQIHDRITYVRALMDSLKSASNISDALVIFSHDLIDERIDDLAWNPEIPYEIIQIYFPYSSQLYPDEFPGPSQLDCPERIGRVAADQLGCLNHDHPDTYGNYRAAKLTQVKHHWWWKMHFVFKHVSWARENVPVIFLEEDHYVLPDALFVLDELLKLRETACTPRCPVIAISHHKTKLGDERDAYSKYFVHQWVGSRDNIGIVFDYDHYKHINECAKDFCSIDDYNWDWSLHFVIANCFKKEYPMLLALAPRVLHIGDCGGLHHKKSCDPVESVRIAADKVRKLQSRLFPKKLEQSHRTLQKPKDPKVNGGWGDPRDHNLCLNISSSFTESL